MSERTLTLEEIKQVELDILKYLHDLCEQHQIKYFIDFGTLLGAVRHKGFIPWDDDTDISLARDEFEKLYKVLQNENHPYYKLISFRETKLQCVFSFSLNSISAVFFRTLNFTFRSTTQIGRASCRERV